MKRRTARTERVFEFPYFIREQGSQGPYERVVIKAQAPTREDARRGADVYVRERYDVATVH